MKLLITNTAKVLLLFFFFGSILLAQEDSIISQDTNKVSDQKFVMQKSPWGAVLRSALIPGWGQIYNESYWKAPIVWGITGWFVFAWIDNNNKYIDNKNIYFETGIDRFKRLRDFYRDQRDEFAIYIALTYFLNLVDAYVDAHLFDFSVEENFYTGQRMYSVRFHF